MARINNCVRIAHIIVVFLSLVLGGVSRLNAQPDTDCEHPLFIQMSGAQANVLFIFDNSSSMNEAIWHDDYDPNVVYSGMFDATRVYWVRQSGWYVPKNFNGSWPKEPQAYLIESDEGQDGRYMGNYLNWIYFNATEEQRLSIPRMTRIEVAKAAVASVIINTDNIIRFGLMKFDNNNGGYVVAGLGSDKSYIISQLYLIAGTTWTPIAETMVDAMEYLQSTDEGNPIEDWCQKTFIVAVTDGIPTMDQLIPDYIGDYDGDGKEPSDCEGLDQPYPNSYQCSDYMDDVALYMYENDLRSDLDEKQNVITYVIGYYIDSGILREAAEHGDGLYLNAFNPKELWVALQNVLHHIISRISSGSAVAVVSQETQESGYLLRGKFVPLKWEGYLEAFKLPYTEGASPIWEAGAILQKRDSGTRTIFTTLDGQTVDFSTSNVSTLQPYMSIAAMDTAKAVIDYLRGNEIPGFRDRDGWKLGDIVDSSPIVVGPPKHFFDFLNYSEFRDAQSDREPVVYIGANDGMLHCFRISDGYEKWAFIPSVVLGKLKYLADLRYCHKFYVNLTPRVVDAFIGGAWRTILIGGEREGGESYFALDITNPNYPKVLWETLLSIHKNSWTVPTVVRPKNEDAFVAFIGSGLDPAGEAYLVSLDMETGTELWSDLLSTSASLNMATAPSKVDLDFDGYDDLLYTADLTGNVWRINLESSPWEKTLLFRTDQPIQANPILTMDLHDKVYLYFGTGQYLVPEDIEDTSQQTFYCVIDDHSGSTLSRSDLVDQTYSIDPVPTDKKGWFIDLVTAPGERVIKPNALVAEAIYFTSFQPTREVCEAGGKSWLYSVDYLDGSVPDSEDGSENDTTEGRVEDIGDGLASEPIIDFVNEELIIQSSDSKISVLKTKTALQRLIVRSWRPLY